MEEPNTVALIAHDGKKPDMVAFAMDHKDALEEFKLAATGTTGRLLQQKVGLEINRYSSGPLGGDVQIAAQVVQGNINAVIFLVDAMDKHPHDPDIQTLMRTCNVHNVPLASNLATAELLLGRPYG